MAHRVDRRERPDADKVIAVEEYLSGVPGHRMVSYVETTLVAVCRIVMMYEGRRKDAVPELWMLVLTLKFVPARSRWMRMSCMSRQAWT